MNSSAPETAATATPVSGVLLVDKPGGITSHDAVARTRRLAGTRRVGHAGTLDPMATGLLLLGIGSSTRLLTHLVGLDKTYTATIRLGVSTVTDDAEGDVVDETDASHLREGSIRDAIGELTGPIEQVPSTVSAIKVDGKRAHALVRAGEEVRLNARPVTIHRFDVTGGPRVTDAVVDLDVTVTCSSGTYIRALARDLGAALGVGGHLTALRRTHVGPFDVADALVLPERGVEFDVGPHVQHPAAVAGAVMPIVTVDDEQCRLLQNGRRIPLPGAPVATSESPLAVVAVDGRLIGLVTHNGREARVLVNFPTDN